MEERQLPNGYPMQPRPQGVIVMESVIGAAHGDDWSPWYTCGDVVDQWIITVYANDVYVQFAPLEREQMAKPPIKRRVGESGRDRLREIGIGQMRVKSAVPGANGTFDLELYS